MNPIEPRRHRWVLFILALALALGLSQAVNAWVRSHVAVGESRMLAPWLWLTHVRNVGGIFGSFPGWGWLFALLSLGLLAGLIVYLIRAASVPRHVALGLGLIAGGGVSNLLDRMLFGGVTDYIDVRGIPYWMYIFNTADTMIHLGLWPMLLVGWRKPAKHRQRSD